MIGFNLKAEGSNGFRQERGAWTEGSLVALKVILDAGKRITKRVKDPFTGSRKDALSSIESSFKEIADSRLQRISSMGLDFSLTLKGDISLTYHFSPRSDWERTRDEFLEALAEREAELGDQVMIYLCSIIEDFAIYNMGRAGQRLELTVEVDL